MRAHERYVADLPGVAGITHFYSSEPYGEHMSLALAAIDRRVDESREQVPISGREVRCRPFLNRGFVHPLVYRDLIVNVAFLGAPCTGKTTLAERLAHEFDTQWMPEYGREYWEEHQVDRRLGPEQLVEIAETHVEREDSLLEHSNHYLFTDTNAITTATFARYYHGTLHPRLAELVDRAVTRYDVVFVCDIDIPYVDSWDRSGEVSREAFQRQVIGDLNEHKVPFLMLRGNVEDRIACVRAMLSRFSKYMNVLELFESRA
jgi:NadR type nicotinamide-nucleotide adenylyltransferase